MKTKGLFMSMVAAAAMLLPSATALAQGKVADAPNYVKALGFNAPVKTLGAYSDDMDVSDGDYCTYEFDREGRLISYDQSETIEGAYSFTIFYGLDGLPTRAQSVFVNWWNLDADGNPPITTTPHEVRKSQDGDVTRLYISGLRENEEEAEVKVTRDAQGRIIEVDDISNGVVNRYRYPAGDNVPCYYDGTLAFPQIDMFKGHRVSFPPRQAVPTGVAEFKNGAWNFEVKYFE